ncbi:Light-inducible protein CPRF2 [Camellia lanceoleosa]|uniref:Light-inducible protein CPRF2 n=1 Tax=Camellia lanceoleosa TaxID=1840588 RepID=A0ACC0FW04_9ERIC|nr:Light-inducible protein CPRF2 [Camellia lanceoleosa]
MQLSIKYSTTDVKSKIWVWSTRYKDVIGPLGIPSLPVMEKKSVVQVKSTTSGSSREQSDDDEAEGETETNNMEPTDAKHVRSLSSVAGLV